MLSPRLKDDDMLQVSCKVTCGGSNVVVARETDQ